MKPPVGWLPQRIGGWYQLREINIALYNIYYRRRPLTITTRVALIHTGLAKNVATFEKKGAATKSGVVELQVSDKRGII